MPLNQWSETILIAELNDEPAFSDDMDSLGRRLGEISGPLPDVIVDLKAVTYLNSSNIAQLLSLRKQLSVGDARLRICALSDAVWSVLATTGLDKMFQFTDDVSTSLASLQMREQ
ncbi:MAG: STAS domain-containing protein [Phycisphaerales bacterium]|nr:MAG: STAS domain-containing protein [Phycisphaerales bacterium]